jgi:hypothetical protein
MSDPQVDGAPQQSLPVEPVAAPTPYEQQRLPDEAFEVHYRSDQTPPELKRR